MKVIFAGTPDFALTPLQGLIDSRHEIVAVFTQPDRRSGRGKKLTPPPVKVTAEQNQIPVFQPHSLKDQDNIIKNLNADAMIVVAYGMLIPQSILSIPRLGCINIHASILPRWRGAAPIQRAIEAGDSKTGVSIMQMDVGLDTGPVYQTLSIDIDEDDTSITLHNKLSVLGTQGLIETLANLEENPDLAAIAQDDAAANYAKKIQKAEAQIDWTESANQIQQRIRAFNPWPICQSSHQGNRIRIWQSSVVKMNRQDDDTKPGQIIDIDQQGVLAKCGQDYLLIQKLQRDGSRPLLSPEFLNGYSIEVGDLLT